MMRAFVSILLQSFFDGYNPTLDHKTSNPALSTECKTQKPSALNPKPTLQLRTEQKVRVPRRTSCKRSTSRSLPTALGRSLGFRGRAWRKMPIRLALAGFCRFFCRGLARSSGRFGLWLKSHFPGRLSKDRGVNNLQDALIGFRV